MMLLDLDTWQAVWLSLALASATTLILLVVGLPLSWWLATASSPWRTAISTLTTLPLVLPPSVLGFYLLLLLGPQGWVGQATQALGIGLLSFSFGGLLIGSLVFSLPFAVLPLQYAFEALGKRPLEVASTLRARPIDAFFSVALPLIKPAILSAAVLSFAHTLGEFGVVLMIGGNIPGKTAVISTKIYSHVEALEYTQAHWLAVGMVVFSFVVLFVLASIRKRSPNQRP